MFHYSGNPATSAAKLLGSIGSKPPKPSGATWGVVLLAGGAYAYHGYDIGRGGEGLKWQGVATFALLKFAVAAKLRKVLTHPKGRPGALTGFIGGSEVLWGSEFCLFCF